jgi:hypothetical protein
MSISAMGDTISRLFDNHRTLATGAKYTIYAGIFYYSPAIFAIGTVARAIDEYLKAPPPPCHVCKALSLYRAETRARQKKELEEEKKEMHDLIRQTEAYILVSNQDGTLLPINK